jgi:two-component system KDP operon response regulator KdpE
MSAPEKPIKILVVDDEEQIRRALKSILSVRKYDVVLAENGDEALDKAIDFNPDLVILDLTMPGMSGIEVCKELRTWYAAPILVLSVRGSEADKITALDAGADDYLTKPFSAGELLARIRALLRRPALQTAAVPVISVGDLEIDIPHRRVRRGSEEI